MAPASPAVSPAPSAFRAETIRGVPAYFRVAQDAGGHWWLVDPHDRPFFCKAVHGVRVAPPSADGRPSYDSAARLRSWGFNATGTGGDSAGWADGFAFLASVEFCSAGPLVSGPGLRLPDVFDPQWAARAQRRADEICRDLVGEHNLIGWITDDSPGWAQPGAPGPGGPGRPTLLQLCLSLEPSFAAYHAAWEFALALHGGRLDALARSWGVTLPNRETMRTLTRSEAGIASRGYLRDETRWTREFARRYFTTTAAAIRAADPHHLVLGCRFAGATGAAVLSQAVYPAVDLAMPDWRELPAAADSVASTPVILGGVDWTLPEFRKLPTAARLFRLTSLEWMLRRARSTLERAARHPAAVGYFWSQWQDEPGEQPPFARGLVHVNGAEAREHTELLAEFNSRAESIRRAAAKPASP